MSLCELICVTVLYYLTFLIPPKILLVKNSEAANELSGSDPGFSGFSRDCCQEIGFEPYSGWRTSCNLAHSHGWQIRCRLLAGSLSCLPYRPSLKLVQGYSWQPLVFLQEKARQKRITFSDITLAIRDNFATFCCSFRAVLGNGWHPRWSVELGAGRVCVRGDWSQGVCINTSWLRLIRKNRILSTLFKVLKVTTSKTIEHCYDFVWPRSGNHV